MGRERGAAVAARWARGSYAALPTEIAQMAAGGGAIKVMRQGYAPKRSDRARGVIDVTEGVGSGSR